MAVERDNAKLSSLHHKVLNNARKDYTDKDRNLSTAKSESEYIAMQIEGDKQNVRAREKAAGNTLDANDYYNSPTKGLPE